MHRTAHGSRSPCWRLERACSLAAAIAGSSRAARPDRIERAGTEGRHVPRQPRHGYRLRRSGLAYFRSRGTIEYATCSKLMNYPGQGRRRRARGSSRRLQRASRRSRRTGRRYTFTLKKRLSSSATARRSRPPTTRLRSTAPQPEDGLAGAAVHRGHRRRVRRSSTARPPRPRASRCCRRTSCRSRSRSVRLTCSRGWRCRSSARSRRTCRSTRTASPLRWSAPARTTSRSGSPSARSRCVRNPYYKGAAAAQRQPRSSTTSACR